MEKLKCVNRIYESEDLLLLSIVIHGHANSVDRSKLLR